jgi:cytochrome P450
MTPLMPPRPASREGRVSLWRYGRLFRDDILSAQPERLYRAKMAEFRTPFFRSAVVNDTALIDTVLRARPEDFPKSARMAEGLRPLLGRSVFLTNGAEWERQRSIIDPAFTGRHVRDSLPAMREAAEAAAMRLAAQAGQVVEVEAATSHVTADVIFRTLFSLPIEDAIAVEIFHAFRAFQRSRPLVNLAALVPLPGWVPRGHP